MIFHLRNRYYFLVDILTLSVTPLVALILRTELSSATVSQFWQMLVVYTVFALIVRISAFRMFGIYKRYWRYAGINELLVLSMSVATSSALLTVVFLLIRAFTPLSFPGSVPIIDSLLVFLTVGATRMSMRYLDYRQRRNGRLREGVVRVLVVGAGDAGALIAREMIKNEHGNYQVIGFVDDNPDKHDGIIHGVSVLGSTADILRLVRHHNVQRVVIALPNAPGKKVRDIVNICEQADVDTKIVPSIESLIEGDVSVRQLRDVDIEDLLRREPVQTDMEAVQTLIRGRRVLVTGGGGSIGTELCRQIWRCNPEHLILLGHGENSIFDTHNELRRRATKAGLNPNEHISAVIADIRFASRIKHILKTHKPDIIFHAAAHKHVPLMEMNPTEAITNNVVGTRNMLNAAVEADVQHFVMVSTDKAVNPTNVMGASKRTAELLVHDTARRTGRNFVAVRFGNVLGSRGSVIHTFKRQIAAGGPVTVTHPEVDRFFMTIPEAVQLVLQASVLGSGGEVFVLDMGEPVKIIDLARDLIALSGLELGQDIDIAFVGLRPGEKLREELFNHGEEHARTGHHKIFLSTNACGLIPEGLHDLVDNLVLAAEREDAELVRRSLKRLVPGFQPGKLFSPDSKKTPAPSVTASPAQSLPPKAIFNGS